MATGTTPAYTTVANLANLMQVTNTSVKTGIKLVTEEAKWFRDYPREKIVVSGNQNRIPLVLTYPTGPGMIVDGGYENTLSSPAPTYGTFMPVQMNKRYSYTGLAQALDNKSRAAMIERQTAYQAAMAASSMGRALGLQTYGSAAGTVAAVLTTGSASATQVVPLKNAFGSTVWPGSTTTAQQTYISSLFRVGDVIALIHSAAILEFGTVTAAPSATSGVGYIDVTFNSSITPTAGDLIVFANIVTDATLTGTDQNNWPIGFADALTATSVHGVSDATYTNWAPGYANTSGGIRFGFLIKEAMANGIWNAAGVKMDRIILSQGVRRDVIDGQRGALRYDDSEEMDLEGELEKFEYLTSQLVPPGTAIGYYSQAVSKVELSAQPDNEMGPSIFKLDKVQDRSAMAASYDYFYARIYSSRGALAYATGMTESP